MREFFDVESVINYHFKNTNLLKQAFIRRSYSEENGGVNNEVLEFIGDKALDLAVIRIMMEKFGNMSDVANDNNENVYFETSYNEGNFTDIKKELVEKKALAKAMDTLGFYDKLIMGQGDIKNKIQNENSVKEDLFESIIGAVALDCNYNMDIIKDVVANMIDFDDFFSNKENLNGSKNYVALLQEWCQKNLKGLPFYDYDELDEGFFCCVKIPTVGFFEGEGSSKAKARLDVAKEAYTAIQEMSVEKNKYIEAVGIASIEDAVMQLNELIQKGLVEDCSFEFRDSYKEFGEAVWTCRCTISNPNYSIEDDADSKKQAKKFAAYHVLEYLMDM